MKKDIDLMMEILKRQLGYEPTPEEMKNMENLLSLQIGNKKKVRKALKALEEVYKNEKCSWYDGQYIRNKDCLDKPMIYYRGNTMTKEYVFDRAREIATALYANGITKGKSFAICTSNIPEFITILLATSYVGAEIHVFENSFKEEYIQKIINSCDAEMIFISDDKYEKIKPLLSGTKIKKKVLLSLNDHLPEKFPERYERLNIPKALYDFPNKAIDFQQKDNNIILINDFIKEGAKYSYEEVKDKNPSIHDNFTITYSSGSSRPGMPKAIPHKVLGYLTMMRFHDSDMSGLPDLSDIVGLAHLPTISDTNIKSIISDTLGQKSIVACEPIYGAKTLIYSILMNQPNFCDATRSSWIQFAKDVMFNPEFFGIDLSYLALPLAVGEPLETNERDFIDKAFSLTKAGHKTLKKLGLPLPHTYLGEGGGRTENGGVVYTVFQSLFEKLNKFRLKKGKYGMAPCLFVDTAIINSQGEECAINEIGELVADSACTMTDYKYFFDEDNDYTFLLKDKYGRFWPRFKVYAYRNELGNIIMKGRMGSEFKVEDQKIPEFIIADLILRDKKNILSCEVVNYNNIPIVEIELNPFSLQKCEKQALIKETLTSIEKKCQKTLPKTLTDNIIYRIKSYKAPFDLTGCEKRDPISIINKGTKDCVKPILIDNDLILISADQYFKIKNSSQKYQLIKQEPILERMKKKIKKLNK